MTHWWCTWLLLAVTAYHLDESQALNSRSTPNNVCPGDNLYYRGGGTILSPGYPNKYAAGLHCWYKLVAKDKYVIRLLLDDLKPNYETDYLYVKNNFSINENIVRLFPTEAQEWRVTTRANRIGFEFYGRVGGTWKITWVELLESSLDSPLPEVSSNVAATRNGNYMCELDYVLHEDRCYRIVTATKRNFYDAVLNCRDEKGDLVAIHNQQTNDYLQSIINGEVLIGLLYLGNNNYQWSDGTPENYTGYAPEFITMRDNLGYCAKLKGGMWYNAECTDKMNYVCEKKALNFTPTPNNVCPNASTIYKDSGVILSPGYPSNYNKLPSSCYYELLVKETYFIRLFVQEISITKGDGFWLDYLASSGYVRAAVESLADVTLGTELIIPHNRIRLTFHGDGSGKFRLSFKGIEKP